jgi:hypothetical protein
MKEAPDTVMKMPQHQSLRRFSDIYIPLRKLSLTPRILPEVVFYAP